MSNYKQDLIGNSIQLMEVDDEEFDYDSITIKSDINDLVNNFGKEDFKDIFLNLNNEINMMNFENKRELCRKLTEKVYEVYNFEFPKKLDFDNERDVDNFLKFIKFLEFDYINEISLIITNLNIDLLKKDISLFLKQNLDNIISKIDFLINSNTFSMLISEFFRTNNKNNIINFLKSKFEKDKMIIILKMMEGEILNE